MNYRIKSSIKNSLRQVSLQLINSLHKKSADQSFPFNFIHVGKCGGTSIVEFYKSKGYPLQQYHLRKPPILEQANYILWIRDPIKRFVSAFNHSKTIATFDISLLNGEKPSLANCQAPQRIQWKINSGSAYPAEYEALLQRFESANQLAEALTGVDATQKKLAKQLMTYPLEHIFKGIGWYLDNGRFVDLNRNRFFFCGSIEHMNTDINLLFNKMKVDTEFKVDFKQLRKNKSSLPSTLSEKARKNIHSFYKYTDYLALERLANYGIISDQLLDLYINNVDAPETYQP